LVVDYKDVAECLVDIDEGAAEAVGHREEGSGENAVSPCENPRVVIGHVGVCG